MGDFLSSLLMQTPPDGFAFVMLFTGTHLVHSVAPIV